MICKSCGTANTTTLPGSGGIEAVLWILIPLWPAALIYSIWRRSSRRRCSACGSTDLVGVETPVGRALTRAHHPGGLPAIPAPPPIRFGRLFAWSAGVVFLMIALLHAQQA